MKNYNGTQLKKKIRAWLALFVLLLILSGITAFPLETELKILNNNASSFPQDLRDWIGRYSPR